MIYKGKTKEGKPYIIEIDQVTKRNEIITFFDTEHGMIVTDRMTRIGVAFTKDGRMALGRASCVDKKTGVVTWEGVDMGEMPTGVCQADGMLMEHVESYDAKYDGKNILVKKNDEWTKLDDYDSKRLFIFPHEIYKSSGVKSYLDVEIIVVMVCPVCERMVIAGYEHE